MPHSKVNLLSTEQMFKDKLVSCAMVNGNALIFMNKHFQQVLKAVNRGNGAYVCTSDDLRKAFNNQPSHRSQINWTQPITIYHPNINETTVEVKPGQFWVMPSIVDDESLSTHQAERAKEARELHNSLGHPGDKALSLALDNGNLLPTQVTSQDLKNANLLLGPCIPCIQSKMRAPTERSSDSPHAQYIGQKVQ